MSDVKITFNDFKNNEEDKPFRYQKLWFYMVFDVKMGEYFFCKAKMHKKDMRSKEMHSNITFKNEDYYGHKTLLKTKIIQNSSIIQNWHLEIKSLSAIVKSKYSKNID